jgi:uncharacterized protein (DUF433 family)
MTAISSQIDFKYLERDPKSSYKQLSIKGRRIRARTLYGFYMSEDEPMTVEEIAQDYSLPVEAVREAIAYCESNPPEIADDFRREEEKMEAAGMNEPNYKFHPSPRVLTPQEIASIDEAS